MGSGVAVALVSSIAFLAGCGSLAGAPATAGGTVARAERGATGIVIANQHGRTYRGLHVSSLRGDCVLIANSSGITIAASQIGPCGGNGIEIAHASGVRVFDSYVHSETLSRGCCDRNDGILVEDASDVTVRGNVVAYGESNVEAPQRVAHLVVEGNLLLNPRGPFPRGQNVQAWNARDVAVRGNYALSSPDAARFLYPGNQEDSINFGIGSGFVAEGNYVTGGRSPSGCGIIADDGANRARFTGNVLVDTGQCGIGVASGTDQLVDGNRVFNRNPVAGGGNTAIYVWNQYKGVACGPVTLRDDVATEIRPGGVQAGFWDGGGCGAVRRSHDVWGRAAQTMLTPVARKLPPPPIPPQPERCAAASPYTTQTSVPRCPP